MDSFIKKIISDKNRDHYLHQILEIGDKIKFKISTGDWVYGEITYHELDNNELYLIDLKYSEVWIDKEYLRLVERNKIINK